LNVFFFLVTLSLTTNQLYNIKMSLHIDNKILLEHVNRNILLKDRNPENLLRLLRLVDTSLTAKIIESSEEVRVAAMKDLMIKIHPNNFPSNPDAFSIYEDAQGFFEACNQNMNATNGEFLHKKSLFQRKPKPPSPTTVVSAVVQFNVRQKWSYLEGYLRPLSPDILTSGKILAPLVAYQCINSRGAITHGKRPSLIYSWENVQSCTGLSVMEIFNKHGGFKTFKVTDDVKVEIIENGPVISFSFLPTEDFSDHYGSSIIKSRINKHHYCMIIGWKLSEFGEVWLVQTYDAKHVIEIPFGSYSIDETILAPKDDFFNITWQQGPYFDRDLSKFPEWYNYKEITFLLNSEELENFCEMALEGKSILEANSKKTRFVIRDKNKPAHSRSCALEDIKWEKDIKMWKLTCGFNGVGSFPKLL
jgi:hypothetical protein